MDRQRLSYACEVMKAALEGYNIQFRYLESQRAVGDNSPFVWFDVETDDIVWNWGIEDYCIKPFNAEAIWEHVGADYNFLAMDESGEWYFFENLPHVFGKCWNTEHDDSEPIRASVFAKIKLPRLSNAEWKNSLFERPK